MEWPVRSTLRVVDSSTGEPVPNLLLFVEIVAPQKNNYSIGPLLTGPSGEAVLERADAVNAIERAMRESPMDYSSRLSDCTGDLLVTIDDGTGLGQRISRLAAFYPEEADRLRDLSVKVVNSRIKSARVTRQIAPSITLQVEKVAQPSG